MSAASMALAELYEAHATELQKFARRRVGNYEAEDIVQDAYLHLLQRKSDDMLDRPRAYLFRITANLSIDYARRAKTRADYCAKSPDDGVGGQAPDDFILDALEVRRLDLALSQLPKTQRDTFLLSRLHGLTHAEIADRLDISIRTVDRYLDRVAIHLRGAAGTA